MDRFDETWEKVLSAPDYPEFKKRLFGSGCPRCPELARSRTHIVVDRGNPQAKIMVIGEAPGQNEDEQGLAFVGRAGKLLDKIMASIGLNTNEDMLIVNVVKCRPPQNRPPQPAEAHNCRPYLEWQLKSVKPHTIVLLGATAAKHLMPDSKSQRMKEKVGQLFSLPPYPGIQFMLLYHPAYLLRDPRKMKDMEGHVKGLRHHLDRLKTVV